MSRPQLHRAQDSARMNACRGLATEAGCTNGSNLRDGNTDTIPCFSAPVHRSAIYTGTGHSALIDFDCTVSQGFFRVGPDWGCYRRNYMTVHATLTRPAVAEDYFVLNRQRLVGFAFHVSAVIVDDVSKTAELIQHTPKRDKGPQQAPSSINVSWQDPGAVWNRLQYKTATSNNGKKKGQQRFSLKVTLLGCSQSMGMDCWIELSERYSEPMIVRGRSPGHYNDSSVPHSSSRQFDRHAKTFKLAHNRTSQMPISRQLRSTSMNVNACVSDTGIQQCHPPGPHHYSQSSLQQPNAFGWHSTFAIAEDPVMQPEAVHNHRAALQRQGVCALAPLQGRFREDSRDRLPTYDEVNSQAQLVTMLDLSAHHDREVPDIDAAMLLASMSDARNDERHQDPRALFGRCLPGSSLQTSQGTIRRSSFADN